MNDNKNHNSLALLSINRPVFITCVVFLILLVGLISMKRLPVNLFPEVNFPVVFVQSYYPGAGPKEVEQNISKVIEEELSSVVGLKRLSSISREGLSVVICEFRLKTDIRDAEQQVRDRLSTIISKLPADIDSPVIKRLDPSNQPVLTLTVTSKVEEKYLANLIDDFIKPKLEQIDGVSMVKTYGIRNREIKVELDQNKLKSSELSAEQVLMSLARSGSNIPAGTVDIDQKKEGVFRTLGEYSSIKEIGQTVVSFRGNDIPVTVDQIAQVIDDFSDEKTKTYVNGAKTVTIDVYKQSSSNTVKVVDLVKSSLPTINKSLDELKGKDQAIIDVIRDGSSDIRANVIDVKESIFIGVILTILVVYLFLKNMRSTIITGLAIPNSLLGAFIMLLLAGFSINMMTLLALSLSVGLLIDDAIVVRENIFRHMEMGKDPKSASLIGTTEVTMAVLATTLTIFAVFGPVAFLDGMVGQFFKEFGLCICFVMLISTFDALTIAPMLSTYYVGAKSEVVHTKDSAWFEKLKNHYNNLIDFSIKRPLLIVSIAMICFIASIIVMKWVPRTFLPAHDKGEFTIAMELPPGTALDQTDQLAKNVESMLRSLPEINKVLTYVGKDLTSLEQPNALSFYITLVPKKNRNVTTSEFKDVVRKKLNEYSFAKPQVRDYDPVGGGDRPFLLAILGDDLDQLKVISHDVFEFLKSHPSLQDVSTSLKEGKPEVQIIPNRTVAEDLGISITKMGQELRILMAGQKAGIYRDLGYEYDISVRLKEDQRNLLNSFDKTYVPNINYSLIPLNKVSTLKNSETIADIQRQNRQRYIVLGAEVNNNGPGLAKVVNDVQVFLKEQVKLPSGMSYQFLGQTESFKEMEANMSLAALFAVIFIYLVLASLYESFILPLSIMVVLPLAICGAFFALFVTGKSLDIFSIIGCILLLGIATKNSIILIDYANQLVKAGESLENAIRIACQKRVRPILMTSMTLIVGMLPVAYGLNEVSKQRMSMGIAVIGGVLSSTLLTLVVVPAVYSYFERFRVWSLEKVKKTMG